MKKFIKLLLVSALTLPVAAGALPQEKPASTAPIATTAAGTSTNSANKAGAELTPGELRQMDRFADLYEEYAQQAAEAQARLKVLQEMQQKLMTDFNSFQARTIAARGYKAGEGVLDLQQRKVIAAPERPDKPSTPSK
jgi:hypothetical protein